MGPGPNPSKVTPRGDHKVSFDALCAWADRALQERGYVAACGHCWGWGSDSGIYAWATARGLQWSDQASGLCEVPSATGNPCVCLADHLVFPPIPSWAKGTPRQIWLRVLREAAADGDDPRRLLAEYWKAYSQSEWRFGKKTTWRILALRGLDDPDLIAIANYYREDHGEGAIPIPTEAARREAERLRRGTVR